MAHQKTRLYNDRMISKNKNVMLKKNEYEEQTVQRYVYVIVSNETTLLDRRTHPTTIAVSRQGVFLERKVS